MLFVSHDASRTGAPMLLLHLLGWLAEQRPEVRAQVLLLRGGPLQAAFEALAPTRTVPGAGTGGHRALTESVELGLDHLGAARVAVRLRRARLKASLKDLGPFDLAYLSAAPSLELLDVLPPELPVLGHIHELEGVLAAALPGADGDRRLARCTHLVVGAEAVRANLVDRHGIDPATVSVRAEFVPDQPEVTGRLANLDVEDEVRTRLGIAPDSPIVGACASTSRRKGLDLFVLVAQLLRHHPAAPHFVWVGGTPHDLTEVEARIDVERAGLADRVHLVGEQVDLNPWFSLFDVFALPSREDSFPLVCLLAGLHTVPVVAFDTGVGDLLADGRGVAVADLDPWAMAREVGALLDNAPRSAQLGAVLRREVRERHITDVAAPRLWQVAEWVADGRAVS